MANQEKRTTIGGQALIEGIMMQGPKKRAIVVRGENGLVVKEEEIKFIKDKYPILGWPLVRGCVNFLSSMSNGVRALMFSAEQMPLEEQEAQESKIDKWINEHFSGEKAEKLMIGVAMVIGIGLAVVLFMLLPTLIFGGALAVIYGCRRCQQFGLKQDDILAVVID